MRSTGEVMGLDWRRAGEADMAPAFARAFAKSQLGGGMVLPAAGAVFVSVKDADKPWIVEPVRLLAAQRLHDHRHRRHRRLSWRPRASRWSG